MTALPEKQDKKVLVHIGMPKGASTWLQKRFFNPEHGYHLCKGPFDVHLEFLRPPDFNWFPPQGLLDGVPDHLVPTVSSETLIGDPLRAGLGGERNLHRLRIALPHAKILIVIREQYSMLRSIYQLLVTWGYANTIDEVINAKRDQHPNEPYFNLSYLCYNQAIMAYSHFFGAENLLVLPIEMLRESPLTFLSEINDFSGVDSKTFPLHDDHQRRLNKSRSLASLSIKRLHNRYLAQTPFSPFGLYRPRQVKAAANFDIRLPAALQERQESRFREKVRDSVGDFYDASNAHTEKLTGLDLGRWGYRLPATPSQ